MVKRFFQYLYMFGSEQLLGGFWFLRQLLLASILGWIVIKAAQTLRKRFPSLDYKMLCFMGGGILLIFTTLSYKHNLRIPFLMNKLSFLSALFYMSGYIFKLYSPKISQWLLPVLFMITTIGSVMCPVSMLDMKIQWLLPYIAIALTGCIMVFIMSDIISHTPLSILGNYVGTHTLTILTWHFLMFKFISIIIIVINKMDINLLSAFPVIEQEAHKGWWIAYAIVGISFPLYMANKKENYQSKTVNKNSTH